MYLGLQAQNTEGTQMQRPRMSPSLLEFLIAENRADLELARERGDKAWIETLKKRAESLQKIARRMIDHEPQAA